MTIRQFKFGGSAEPGSTGIITLNGIEAHNGAFTDSHDKYSIIAAGSIEINDKLAVKNIISVPTSVIATSGDLHVALTKWNYGPGLNPVFTPEQIATITAPETSRTEIVAIYEAVAVPPLNSADVTMLLSNDPANNSIQQEIKDRHNITVYLPVPDSTMFATGIASTTSLCNRSNVLLNGHEPLYSNTSRGIYMADGDVLTYDSLVFPSNWRYNI
jgi:hypothetical protein